MCYNRLAMDKDLGFKGYGTRCFPFLLDAAISVLLSIVLYFTLGKYGIAGPLEYETKYEHLMGLVYDSGLVDEAGSAFYFEAIDDEGKLGADFYGSIVWNYYFVSIPGDPDLSFSENDSFAGNESDAQAVGRWIYERVYGYDGSSINPYFAFTSFTEAPTYSSDIQAKLADPETKEETAEELLAFYYRIEEKAAAGAYVDAFYHFSAQPVYLSLYSECSSILYYESLPSYLVPPLLVFGLVPLFFHGRTIGKLIFHLYLVDKEGKKARWHQGLRHYGILMIVFMLPSLPVNGSFMILLSGFLLLIDFIVLLMSKRKQSLHDMLSSTLVYGLISPTYSQENHDVIEENGEITKE